MRKICFFLMMLLGMGCAAGPPSWVTKREVPEYPKSKYIIGIGSGPTLKVAQAGAREDIAGQIKVQVKRTLEARWSETEEKLREEVEGVVSSSVDMTLEGVETVEQYYDRGEGRYYVMAVLSRSAACRGALGRFRSAAGQAREYFSYGMESRDRGDLQGALEHFRKAKKTLLDAEGAREIAQVVCPQALFRAGEAFGELEGKEKVSLARIEEAIREVQRELEGASLDGWTTAFGFALAERIGEMPAVVGAFTYRETGVSGEFRRYLTRKMSSALSQAGVTLRKKDPDHRGMWLSGKYWEDGENVVVYAELEGPGGEITSLQRAIDKDKVSYALEPTLLGEMESLVGSGGKGIKLALWTDKGRKPAYQEGEQMVVFLKADRDCYVQLIYHDAEGRDFLIFPNKFRRDNFVKAGKVYEIPGPGDRFRFTVSPPFGTEVLKAFASTEPIPTPQGRFVGGGLLLMSGPTRDIVEELKRGIQASAGWAEASCTVNT
ncbi:MAG: hypothetical protein DRP95_01120, partial [Candidatus Latescibacterota bacterium]